MIGALLWIPAYAGMTGESFAGMAGESFVGMGESMVAVLVLLDNTASFPRRRESTWRYSELYRSFHFSFVGWAKRSVPNALEASIPDVC